MRRRDISAALFATAAGSTLLATPTQAQTCTLPCYPRTEAEIAHSIMPSNFEYPPGNVKRYGATGTPCGDDTTAILTALQANDEVFFPPGVYRIFAGLVMRSGMRLIGANKATTKIEGRVWNMTMLSISGGHSNIEIRDITLDGYNVANYGFYSDSPSQGSSSGLLLDNVLVSRCKEANIWIKYMTYGTLANVTSSGYKGGGEGCAVAASGNTNYGLYLDHCYNMNVHDSLFYDCVSAGIVLNECAIVNVIDSVVFSNPDLNPGATIEHLCRIINSNACGLVRCTLEAQGTAKVTAELDIDSSGSAYSVGTFVHDCSFLGVAASKTRCVRLGWSAAVYKTTFRGCRFFKPSSEESILAKAQQSTLIDDCNDVASYAQQSYTPVSVQNDSGSAIYYRNRI